MSGFTMTGDKLATSSGHVVGRVRGTSVMDDRGRRIGGIRQNHIVDSSGHAVLTVDGDNVRDDRGHKVTSVSQLRRSIRGATGGTAVVALWYFFVR